MSAPAAPAQGSARLASMRFMLRKQHAVPAASAASADAAWPAPPPPAPGQRARLLCVRDTHSTAAASLDTALTDAGGMVAGRRSSGGANKGVEAAARRAYDAVEAAEEDAALLRAGFAGEARKRAAEGGAAAGGAAAGAGAGAPAGKKKPRW